MGTGIIGTRAEAAATQPAFMEGSDRVRRSFFQRIKARLKPAIKTLVPSAWVRQIRHHRSAKWDAQFQSQPSVNVFAAIYKEAKWGADPRGDFYSGTGSHDPKIVLPYVETVGAFLESLLRAPSVVDLGCGDFNVGSQLRRFCGSYTACDVVPDLISRNQAKFSDAGVDFQCLDLTRGELPLAEIALLRQVLQHLSNVQILAIVPKLYRYKFLVCSEHIPTEANFPPNIEKPTGALVRLFLRSGVVLTEPPFNLKVKSESILCSDAQVVDGHAGCVRTTLYEL